MNLKFYVGNTVFKSIEDYMDIETFYEKIEGWVSSDKSSWNHITLIGYFCYKYERKYGVRYKITSWKGNPGKTKESRDISKVCKHLKNPDHGWSEDKASKKDNMLKVYNYINWVFDYKFRSKHVNSTGLLVNGTLLNEFEKMYVKKLKEHKSKNKAKSVKEWILENTPDIAGDYQLDTKNNIQIFYKFIETNSIPKDSDEYKLYNYLKKMEK